MALTGGLVETWDREAQRHPDPSVRWDQPPGSWLRRGKGLFLEVGIGAGPYAFPLAERATVVGVDVSAEMLRICARRKQQLGYGPLLVRADTRALPFRSGVFDVVCSVGVVEHFPETARAIAEHGRVARPGGTVIISVPHMLSWHYPLKRLAQRLGKYELGYEDSYPARRFRGFLRSAGLTVQELEAQDIETGSTTSAVRKALAYGVLVGDRLLKAAHVGGGHMLVSRSLKEGPNPAESSR